MNRHQRRAARARGNGDPPGAMVETVRRMANRLRAVLRAITQAGGVLPRFALLPSDVTAIAPLDKMAGRVALNASALLLVEDFCRIGLEVHGPAGQPTINMLRATLELVSFPHEERPLEHFGAFAVVERRPRADN